MDQEHQDTRVIVECSQKGGVGKTTMTGNLAATTAEVYPPVLQEGANSDAPTKYQAQVLAVSTDPQQSLLDWLTKVEKTLTGLGKPMPIDYAQEHHNPRVLAKLKSARQYRRIFVDSPGWLEGADADPKNPPQEKQILRATLESADLVVVPIEPELMSWRPTERTIETVIKPMGLPFIVVINNWDPRDGTGDLDDTRRWVEKRGYPLATAVIRRYKLHTTAPASGRLCTHYPGNRTATEARSDYLRLGMELALNGGN